MVFPHPFFSTWFSQNVQGRFEEQLAGFLGYGCTVSYLTGGNNRHPAPGVVAETPHKSVDYP